MRSRVRSVGIGLMWFGAFLLGFVVHQLVITGVLASWAQNDLRVDLAAADVATVEIIPIDRDGAPGVPVDIDLPPERETLPGDDLALPVLEQPDETVLYSEEAPDRGEALGRIRIPDIDVSWAAVEGVGVTQLKLGPGHMETTPLPGHPGNAVISGHRTTYGAPFRHLDQLQEGSVILWDSPLLGTTTYAVTEVFIVRPDEIWVTEPRPGGWLTLTTCNPVYSARERLVVVARMIDGPNLRAIESMS